MKPEMRKKKPTKTKPLLKMGAKISMCGGVKWKKTMLSASRVRRPVRAVNGGLRTMAGAAVATAGVNGNTSLSYLDDRRDGRGRASRRRRNSWIWIPIRCGAVRIRLRNRTGCWNRTTPAAAAVPGLGGDEGAELLA